MSEKQWDDLWYALGTFVVWLAICSPIVGYLSYSLGYGRGSGAVDTEREFTRGAYALCYAFSVSQEENPDTLAIATQCNELSLQVRDQMYPRTDGFNYD